MMLKIALIILIGITSNVSAMPMPPNIDRQHLTVVQVFAETGINVSTPLKTIAEVERLYADVLIYLYGQEINAWEKILTEARLDRNSIIRRKFF